MKNHYGKRLMALGLSVVLAFGVLTGCKAGEDATVTTTEDTADVTEATSEATTEAATAAEEDVTIRIGALSGPTAFGLVSLLDEAEKGESLNTYEVAEFATDGTAFVAPIANGEMDIAMVPANLASVLYNKTNGGVQVLAINTLCVLNVVERGETVNSIEDLKGKTVYATGQGAVPEYVFRYILTQNGLDPDQDLTIQWCADTTEALSYITKAEGAIALLPQPFVTVASTKVEDLRVAIDLNEEWNGLDNGSEQITGVAIVRKEFAQEHPQAVADFMTEYAVSAHKAIENVDETAALIGKYNIVPEGVAKQALPKCNLTFESGDDMEASLSKYLEILHGENPQSVGGTLPGEDFYYHE